ncbi:uncharacterized protein K02A2.6-like [Macrosteles quadrilineatus]|uniref:uncharacterized protein K02A2.6-like n=1 Tax=Macrosteles quadrilineatus TaxID=74068 RepID=UPI0023E22ACC|nr:uncharacterized protein K02A2.6-like [Macrosteles quadrilineatus]
MAGDVQRTVETCWPCQKYAPAQKSKPLQPHNTPTRAWQRVGIDFFQLGSDHFLIMTDYFSSFFELKKVNSLKTEGLIQFCKEQFARYGIPDVVVSDNGTQLVSQDFKLFAQTWMFKIVVSSPHNHQSNGKAESAVKIAKRMLKKVKESKEDYQAALLEWRNTPLADLGASPVQLLMSRSTKTRLPVTEMKLNPKIHIGVTDKLKEKQEKYKKHYDKGTHALDPLKVGQKVLIQKRPDMKAEPWTPGVIVTVDGLRTYIVAIEGRLFRRNRRFIRPFKS